MALTLVSTAPASTVAIGGGIAGTTTGGGTTDIPVYNVVSRGAPSNGTAAAAVIAGIITNQIAGAKATLFFPPGNYGLEANLNIPSNVTVWMAKGARFTAIAAGITLTINGDLIAPTDTIFDQSVNVFTVALTFNGDEVRPEWWGAPGDGIGDDAPAFNRCIASLTSGGRIRLSRKVYKWNSTVNWNIDGLEMIGAGYGVQGTPLSAHPTSIDGSGIPNGSDGLAVVGLNGTQTLKRPVLRGFYIDMGAGVGGAAVSFQNVSRPEVDIFAVCKRGLTSFAIRFGDLSTIANAVIASNEIHGIFISDGDSLLFGVGCTSLNASAYSLGHGGAGVHMKSCTYCSVLSYAADSGAATGYGYSFEAAVACALYASGAEANGKGACLITGGCQAITIDTLRGVGNNTSADATIGSLIEIAASGVNFDITIISPVDSSPNAASIFSIRGGAGNGDTRLLGGNASSLAKGYGGDTTWLNSFLTVLRGAFLQAPVLVPGGRTDTEGNLLAGVDARFGNPTVTLTAARLVAVPTNLQVRQRIKFTFIQGGAGGFAVTWAAAFKTVWSDAGNAAGARSSVEFEYDGVNLNQCSAQAPYV